MDGAIFFFFLVIHTPLERVLFSYCNGKNPFILFNFTLERMSWFRDSHGKRKIRSITKKFNENRIGNIFEGIQVFLI